MPLVVNCSCGKKLQVGDHLAGKKFRCPACQAVLEAPAASEADTAIVVPALIVPPSGPKSKTVEMRTPPPLPGKGKIVAAIVAPSEDDGDEPPPEDEAPKKKKKKKGKKSAPKGPNWALIGGVGGGFLALLILLGVGVFIVPRLLTEAEVDEWALFTQDPAVFATVDLEKMLATPQGAQLKAALGGNPAIIKHPFLVAAEVGLEDIRRASVTLTNPEDPKGVLIVISTNKKMNRRKLDKEGGFQTESMNGRKVWSRPDMGLLLYLAPGEKTLVMGSTQTLPSCLQVKGGGAPTNLPAIIAKGKDSGKHVFGWSKNPDPNAQAPNAAAAVFMTLARFNTGLLTMDLGPTINIVLEFDYIEKAKASAAITTFKSLPLLLGTMTAAMGKQNPQQKAQLDAVLKMLRETKPEQQEGIVKLKFSFPGDDFMAGVVAGLAQSQAMMGAMGGPPGMQGNPSMGGPGFGAPPSMGAPRGGRPSFPGGGPGGPGGGPQANNTPAGGPVTGSTMINKGPGAAVMASRGAGDRAFNQNQLKGIGQALNFYASTNNNELPPATICDAAGRPLLSWRVAILPALDQDNLYRQFNLNEPWDGPKNIKLLPLMPKTFSPRNQTGETHTPYRVFAGNGGAFDPRRPSSLSGFSDGTSNTLMVVETEEMVEWTRPEYLDSNNPPRMGSGGKGQFSAVLADGSARAFPVTMSPNDLRAWITKGAGDMPTAP